MWLRQIKRFYRAKSRIVASIIQPLFFLFILGFGFGAASFATVKQDYIHFLAPGIITMAIMFSSVFAGVSILWDKQFGFLQEVLVAPVSRLSIIVGRTLGGATTALFQGFIILIISIALGVRVSSPSGLVLTLIGMTLISFTAVGFGLIMASKMESFQGFQLVMNVILMPLFLLSSALFPINDPNFPKLLGIISYFNPLFYMVDSIRGSLTGSHNIFHPLIDLLIVFVICGITMGLGSYFFSKSEV
jgi:ABC-2 type transport system permease protein